jgi:hypothetical protein
MNRGQLVISGIFFAVLLGCLSNEDHDRKEWAKNHPPKLKIGSVVRLRSNGTRKTVVSYRIADDERVWIYKCRPGFPAQDLSGPIEEFRESDLVISRGAVFAEKLQEELSTRFDQSAGDEDGN